MTFCELKMQGVATNQFMLLQVILIKLIQINFYAMRVGSKEANAVLLLLKRPRSLIAKLIFIDALTVTCRPRGLRFNHN